MNDPGPPQVGILGEALSQTQDDLRDATGQALRNASVNRNMKHC